MRLLERIGTGVAPLCSMPQRTPGVPVRFSAGGRCGSGAEVGRRARPGRYRWAIEGVEAVDPLGAYAKAIPPSNHRPAETSAACGDSPSWIIALKARTTAFESVARKTPTSGCSFNAEK